MKIIYKNSNSIQRGGKISKKIITASLVFSISAFNTLKPISKKSVISSDISQNQENELKIESYAYDLIRNNL